LCWAVIVRLVDIGRIVLTTAVDNGFQVDFYSVFTYKQSNY
jgi:hypothetical protein